MPSIVRREHRFQTPWESTTTAFWNKYPSEDLKHVKDVLVLDRYIDENGVLYARRVIHMDQKIPSILKPLSQGLSDFFAVEDSIVDPNSKKLTLKTRNLTYSSILNVNETCTYTAEGDSTNYSWEFSCECKHDIPLLTKTIESTLTKQAHGNSFSGINSMVQLANKFHRSMTSEIQNMPRKANFETIKSNTRYTYEQPLEKKSISFKINDNDFTDWGITHEDISPLQVELPKWPSVRPTLFGLINLFSSSIFK